MRGITEAQYELLRPYPPVQGGNVRISNFDVINAVLRVAENGCKWRALPKEVGNWRTIYTRLRRWTENGVLDRLFTVLQELQLIRIKVECLGLDSTRVKVHPDCTIALMKRPAIDRPISRPRRPSDRHNVCRRMIGLLPIMDLPLQVRLA